MKCPVLKVTEGSRTCQQRLTQPERQIQRQRQRPRPSNLSIGGSVVLEYDGNTVTSWEGEGLRNDRLSQNNESSMVCLAQQNGIAVVMQLNHGKQGKPAAPTRQIDSTTTATSGSCGMCAPRSPASQLDRRTVVAPHIFLEQGSGSSTQLVDLTDEPSTCMNRRRSDRPSVTWLIKEA